MGMAASQARLLCITARISDVEFQAQSIQNAKLQLATQSDAAYQEYMEALDAQSLVLRTIDPSSGATSTVTATFDNLCSKNRLNPAANNGYEYALKDARGRLIVEDDVAAGYQEFRSSNASYKNAEAFALYMIYGGNGDEAIDAEKTAREGIENLPTTLNSYEQSIKDLFTEAGVNASDIDIYNSESLNAEQKARYDELMDGYREQLYKYYGNEVVDNYAPNADKNSFDKNHSLFNYYVSIYDQIEANGGAIIAISKFDGFNGNAANDSEWLTAMVQSGLISIDMVKKDDQNKTVFRGTSPSSDTSIKYTETTSVDTTAAKKAEAKYENELRQIQTKDKKYDLSLSKLDAEREALIKQRESLQKVIKDNIDKSFKIFS